MLRVSLVWESILKWQYHLSVINFILDNYPFFSFMFNLCKCFWCVLCHCVYAQLSILYV